MTMHYAGGPAGIMREPYTCIICGWTGPGAGAPLHPCSPPPAPPHPDGCPCDRGAACAEHGVEGACEDCGAMPDEPCGAEAIGEMCILWK